MLCALGLTTESLINLVPVKLVTYKGTTKTDVIALYRLDYIYQLDQYWELRLRNT